MPSSVSWLPPRLILLFQSKINAASYFKCKQVLSNLLGPRSMVESACSTAGPCRKDAKAAGRGAPAA